MDKYNKIGIATNKSILELYQMMRDGSLVLQPSFQRKLVWNNKHKESFIQTILMGLPFPEIYLSDGEIDLENMKSKTLVVDGQQRMNTIYQYITNDEELVLKNTKRFNQLTGEEKQDFLDYPVVVRALGRIPLDKIKEIFNRINSVQYALNAMEINNALYEGEFISTAKKIVDTKLLGDLDVLSETEISRMKDLEFVTLLMATIELGGYFTGNKEVENMIKKYEDEYPNKDKMYNDFKDVLGYIKDLHLPMDSFWYRKSCMFTLIAELMFKVYTNDTELPELDKARDTLISLEKKIIKDKNDGKAGKYSNFYSYIYQGTASRKGRIVRGEVLESELETIL